MKFCLIVQRQYVCQYFPVNFWNFERKSGEFDKHFNSKSVISFANLMAANDKTIVLKLNFKKFTFVVHIFYLYGYHFVLYALRQNQFNPTSNWSDALG